MSPVPYCLSTSTRWLAHQESSRHRSTPLSRPLQAVLPEWTSSARRCLLKIYDILRHSWISIRCGMQGEDAKVLMNKVKKKDEPVWHIIHCSMISSPANTWPKLRSLGPINTRIRRMVTVSTIAPLTVLADYFLHFMIYRRHIDAHLLSGCHSACFSVPFSIHFSAEKHAENPMN